MGGIGTWEVNKSTYRAAGLPRVGTGQTPTGGTTFVDDADAVTSNRYVLAAHVPLHIGPNQAGYTEEKAGPKDRRTKYGRTVRDPANGRVVVFHVLIVQIKHGDHIVVVLEVRVVPYEVARFWHVPELGRDLVGIRSSHFDRHHVGAAVIVLVAVLGDDCVGDRGGVRMRAHVTDGGVDVSNKQDDCCCETASTGLSTRCFGLFC